MPFMTCWNILAGKPVHRRASLIRPTSRKKHFCICCWFCFCLCFCCCLCFCFYGQRQKQVEFTAPITATTLQAGLAA